MISFKQRGTGIKDYKSDRIYRILFAFPACHAVASAKLRRLGRKPKSVNPQKKYEDRKATNLEP